MRDWNAARWSEEYRSRLLQTVIETVLERPERISGLAIWQFCDCRASDLTARMLMRPRGFNNKGIVDEYRRPKMAYLLVRDLFRAAASKPSQ